jgi:TonB family protein
MNEYRLKWTGYGLSVLFHLILLGIFALIQIHQEMVIPEFAEVIVPASGAESAAYETPSGNNIQRAKLPENIELPEKMELKEEDQWTSFTKKKPIEDVRPDFLKSQPVKAPAIRGSSPLKTERIIGEKQLPMNEISRPTLPPLEETSTAAGTEVEKVYQINWEGNMSREVLYEVLPDVKHITGSSATIQLVIYVDRDGTVIRVEPLLKGGNSQLENVAIDAVKKWRFNPVSADSTLQKGVITFKFVSR